MFRKTQNSCDQVNPGPWSEKRARVIPEKGNSVVIDEVSCEDILKVQLDVKKSNLETMLKSGVVLDPALVGRTLNLTDPSDIESYNEAGSLRLYEYLKNNQDKILESLESDRKNQIASVS